MQKWEYLKVSSTVVQADNGIWLNFVYFNGTEISRAEIGRDEIINIYEYLNQLGKEGWEMLGVNSEGGEGTTEDIYYFKRPIE